MSRGSRKIDWVATGCLVGAMLSWGAVPLFLRYIRDYVVDGWTTNGFRYPLGALFYLPFLIRGLRGGHVTGRLLVVMLIPTAINLVGQTAWAWCPYYVEPGLLLFLLRSSVLWSTVLGFAFFADERALASSKRFWGGVLLVAAGLCGFVLIRGDGAVETRLIGVLLALGCALAWSLYGVAMRILVRQSGVGLTFSIVSLYTAAGCIGMMLLWGDAGQLVRVPVRVQAALIGSAIIGIAIAHGLYYVAIQRLGVALSQGAGTFTPFLGIAVSAMLFGERLSMVQWVSGLVLLSGSGLLIWAQQRLGSSDAGAGGKSGGDVGDTDTGGAKMTADHRPASAARSSTSS